MINLTVVIDNDEAIKKLKELQEVAKSTTSNVVKESESMDSSFGKIEKTLAGITAGVSFAAIVKQVVQVRGEVQQLEVAFETMLGSKERANKLVAEAVQLAAKTPFGLQDVSNGAKMLLAYGSAAEEVTDEIKMLGNIASGLSIPLGDLIYLYGTTRTQGRMFTQDLRQFMGRGIPLAEQLAEQFGVTKDKVGELVTAGRVGFEDMAKALQSMTGEGGQFYNLMEKQSETITGQISNLEDSIYQMFDAIGEKSEGIISGAIGVAASLVENYERVGRVLIGLVATYGAYKAAIATYSVVTSVAANAAKGMAIAEQIRITATIAAEKAQKLLNKAMLTNPYVLAATAIVGLVTALVSQKNETERLREAEENYNSAKQETINKEQEHMRAIEGLLSVAENEASSTDTRRAALHSLIMQYPAVFANYSTEIEMLKNIKQIKLEIAQIEAGKSITNPKNELAELDKQEEALDAEWKKASNAGKITAKFEKDWEAKYKNIQNRRKELEQIIRDNNRAEFLSNSGQLSGGQLSNEIDILTKGQEYLKMYNTLKNQAGKMMEATQYLTKLNELGLGGYDEQKIQSELIVLTAEQNKRNAKTLTPSEWISSKKKAWDDAQTALNNFQKQKGGMPVEQFEAENKRLKDAVETAKKEYQAVAPTGGKKGGGKSAAEKQKENIKKAFEITQTLINENIEHEIELSEDGSDKKIKQIEHEYDERMAAIQKKANELRSLQNGILTKEQEDAIANAEKNAKALQDRDKAKIAEDNANAYNDYLAEYGTMQEKKVAIAAKYDRLISEAEAEGNKALVAQLTNERIAAEAAFADEVIAFSNKIKDYSEEKLLENIEAMEAEVESKILELQAMESSDSQSYKDAVKALEELKAMIFVAKTAYDKLVTPSPKQKSLQRELEKLSQSFNEVAQHIDVAGDIVGEFNESIGNAIKGIGNMIPSMLNFASTLATVSTAAEAAGRSLSAMEKASVILAAIGVALKFIQSAVEAVKKAFNQEFDEYEKLKAQYEGLSKIWSELIDKKQEYLSISYGAESIKAAREARELIEEEEALNRKMARERTDTRRERRKVVEGITSGGYKELVEQGLAEDWDAAGDRISYGDYGAVQKRINWSKLLNMTPEQLAELKENAKEFWATMDGDLRQYLENIIATGEKSEDVLRLLNESLTQMSFDELTDSFFDAMMDMDATAEEVANNVSEYFFKAMMMNQMGEKYKQTLEEWYNDFAKAMESDGLTPKEEEDLRSRYKEIVNEGINERNMIAALTGYEGDIEGQSSATSKGFQAMSQETGSELNGRFTDIQGQTHRIAEAVEFCRNIQIQQIQSLQSISSTVAMIHNDTSLIAQHTKELRGMRDDIGMIRRSIDNGAL